MISRDGRQAKVDNSERQGAAGVQTSETAPARGPIHTVVTQAEPGVKPTLTVHEAARLLGVSPSSVYEGIERGDIPHFRRGRRIIIPRALLEQKLGIGANGGNANPSDVMELQILRDQIRPLMDRLDAVLARLGG